MFGERLKKLRENQGLTQNQLADLLNISRQSVSGYENNSAYPDLDILTKIADIFNVSADYLLCRTEEKYNLNLLNGNNKELLFKFYEIINMYNIEKK